MCGQVVRGEGGRCREPWAGVVCLGRAGEIAQSGEISTVLASSSQFSDAKVSQRDGERVGGGGGKGRWVRFCLPGCPAIKGGVEVGIGEKGCRGRVGGKNNIMSTTTSPHCVFSSLPPSFDDSLSSLITSPTNIPPQTSMPY
ncbi:hypothetical protein Pmani_025506 [Petrolisthes manimaculis]|uniref:Uncharacterized protein n=1 Tax=Petrolisthes manimaculis TaxID=1843537 RepID=A0AAE1P5D9_9EUCA|nr:hypothetical protein Pmani_025506 [Petrolisthes manimaculis]